VKLLRSKATKGQLETAAQYVNQIRRVQTEVWPFIVPTLRQFFEANGSVDARLSESATVDVVSGALLSGKLSETVFWNVQTFDLVAWMAMWLSFQSVCVAADIVTLLCDCAEYGIDSLPDWAGYLPRNVWTFSLTVRRNAVKLILLGHMMHVIVETQLPDAVLARMYRLITQAPSMDVVADAQLNGMLHLYAAPVVQLPPAGAVEALVSMWKQAIDEPPPAAALAPFEVATVPPAEMAAHLTRSDCALFWNISLNEFQGFCGLSQSKGKEEGGNVFRLIERRFDRMVWILLSMLCWSDSQNEILSYWISVEEEVEKIGNLHGLMMLNSALSHYLVDGLKKSWASLSVEQSRAHQRICLLFHPVNNYRDYRSCYKERAMDWAKRLFFGESCDKEALSMFAVTMPILQRDVIIGSEMPSFVEHLRPGTLNYQKLRVLGESASMFFLVRASAGHYLSLSGQSAQADLDLLSRITSIPWTDNEDLLLKVARRYQKDNGAAPALVSTVTKTISFASGTGTGRSGYLPVPVAVAPPASSNTTEHSEDLFESETTADEPAVNATPLTVVRNPLIELIAARPARAARIAKMLKKSGAIKFSLAMPGAGASPHRNALSPRGRGMVSPRQSSAPGGLTELLSPRARKQLELEVQWCEKCESRKAVEGGNLCNDCVSSARSVDELTVVLHLLDNTQRRVVILRSARFAELQYVLKCEVGDSIAGSVLCVRVKNVTSQLNDTSWDVAVLRARDSSLLNVYLEQMVPESSASLLKRQNSKWDTLKRGLTLRLLKEEPAKTEPAKTEPDAPSPVIAIQWCKTCGARRAEVDDLCQDCVSLSRSSFKNATIELLVNVKAKTQKLLIHRNIAWKEAKYVLATIKDHGVFSCGGFNIIDDDTWKRALEQELDGSLQITWEE
jgi:hypothetical protein